MAKSQPVWALDIGQASLKAIKLAPGEEPGVLAAEAFDYVEYPKILSQPDADAEELVRDALKTFLERNELKGCKVVIGVPSQASLIKFIKLPPVDKSQIPNIVKFEARQQIPFALEEVIWDYQQIGDDDEEDDEDDLRMAEVGLIAMKREQVQKAMAPLKEAGVEVDVVQMNPLAVFNYLAVDRLGKGLDEPEAVGEDGAPAPAPATPGETVLLDMGADHTDMVITNGTRIWHRNIPIGGNHFTRTLTKELKLTFAKAEHTKKNATSAPDPKAVFTAMRGVFTDFANEVNRSIGFYGSVNRGARIAKVVGMGNGFKLPGLQKFLQQNLNIEVDRLSKFERLVGEEVIAAPQFQENAPAFAVAYGLAVQGLGLGGLSTNLLPPEIKQQRLVRRKKPWALAASVLLMVGFGAMFLGDWRQWSVVKAEPFASAVSAAKSATDTGNRYKADFDSAVGAWREVKGQGDILVAENTTADQWPRFLVMANKLIPDPAKEFNLNPNNPADHFKLVETQIHIDEISPVYRLDLDAEWHANLTSWQQRLMHPLDKKEPPAGPGWIVQIVGHHYNPYPGEKDEGKAESEHLHFGPRAYLNRLLDKVSNDPEFRRFGFSHFTLAWMGKPDEKWTSDMAGTNNSVTTAAVPLLARATPPAASGGGMGDMMDMGMMMGMGGMPGMMGPGGGRGGMPGMGDMEGMMDMGMMMGMGGMPGMMGPGGGRAGAREEDVTYLTRTDFMIQFAWRPVTPDNPAKELEEILKEINEAKRGANPADQEVDDDTITQGSTELSRKVVEEAQEAVKKLQEAAGAAGAGAAGAGTGAGAGAGGTPAATPPGESPAAPPAPPAAPTPPSTPPGADQPDSDEDSDN